jgi:putative polyhydroxyalkanoate system protein
MSTIRISRPHRLTRDHARRTAEAVARRLEARHPVSWSWQGDSLELSAPAGPARGARGRVTIEDRNLAIELHLPLALFPLRSLVEKRLTAKLDELLGS